MDRFSVPLTTTQPRDIDNASECDRMLGYILCPTGSKQKALRNRVFATPDVDLNDYRCRAVVDWIDFLIETPAVARACDLGTFLNRRIKSENAGGVFVYDRERKPDSTGTEFILRLQDPTLLRCEMLFEALSAYFSRGFQRWYPEHEIVGIEIAIDFYPKGSGCEVEKALKRARFSKLLHDHFILHRTMACELVGEDINAWPRYIDNDFGNTKWVIRPLKNNEAVSSAFDRRLCQSAANFTRHRSIPINATYYIGRDESPVSYRLQDKVTNKRKGSYAQLIPLGLRRSRIEVTLLKTDWSTDGVLRALGLDKLDKISGKNFSNLQQMLFNFQLATFAADDTGCPSGPELDIFRKSGALGLDLYHRGCRENAIKRWTGSRGERRTRPLGAKGHNMRFTKLNRMASRALSKMALRFSGA